MLEIKDKARALKALYNASKPLGLGALQFDPKPMTDSEAKQIIDSGQTYFDYLKGRIMKVNLEGDTFDPWLFDRDNGQGAAEKALNAEFN